MLPVGSNKPHQMCHYLSHLGDYRLAKDTMELALAYAKPFAKVCGAVCAVLGCGFNRLWSGAVPRLLFGLAQRLQGASVRAAWFQKLGNWGRIQTGEIPLEQC